MTTDTKAIRAKAKMWHLSSGIADDILALCEALDAAQAENARLQTIIDNLHAVEQKHRETSNAQFHRANRLQVENERLRAALQPFSEEAIYWLSHNYSRDDRPVEGFQDYTPVMTCGDLFDARAALAACKGVRDAS